MFLLPTFHYHHYYNGGKSWKNIAKEDERMKEINHSEKLLKMHFI